LINVARWKKNQFKPLIMSFTMDYPIQEEEGSSPSHISFGFKDIPKLSMDTHQDI
jgi:hypothetical protein